MPKGQPTTSGLAEESSTLEPLPATNATNTQWQRELQRRTQAEIVAGSGTRDPHLLREAYEAFLAAIDTAAPVDLESADSSEDKPQARMGKGVEDTPKSTTHSTGNPSSAPAPSAVSTGLTAHSENIRWVDRVLRKTRVLDLEPAYAGAIVNVPSLDNTTGLVKWPSTTLTHARRARE